MPVSPTLVGKVAIVTGSSGGIGRAIAMRNAADRASVVINYRSNADAAESVVSAVNDAGGQAIPVRADVTDPDQVCYLFDIAEREYGGLDIFVHNAAAYASGPIADATDFDSERTFSINSRATFVALREAAVRIRDGGQFVFVSSGVTQMGGGLCEQS